MAVQMHFFWQLVIIDFQYIVISIPPSNASAVQLRSSLAFEHVLHSRRVHLAASCTIAVQPSPCLSS